MITLLLAVLAAGTANVALVAFMADRLGPKAGAAASAGELVATSLGASAKAGAVKVGNQNASAGRAAVAA
ncbi:hypothetical protein ASF49_07970 [Methylobacterium sp. Leaf104]|uniref:hypothetical protein n=1 Tax=Methylobacterium TaxID=407 RepID=UPI0006FD61A6|nr:MULTISPECIES: hypothetical protein [Methylobacterium]KQP33794.1 hypothetical protein ASF49_07970 [Methylobacterium sp. Leaf104]MCI9879638.1 hypothetical protein [Methylobacterium goesingense]